MPSTSEPSRNPEVFEVASRTASEILASRNGREALQHFAEAARKLVGARYAAIGVASPDGNGLEEFITAGLTDDEERRIGPRPTGKGVLGLLLQRDRPLRLDDLSLHPRSVGVPAGHPPMGTFLGVPIRNGDTVLGSLYLTEKAGGFTDDDEVTIDALSLHLAVAIRNLQMLKRQRALVAGLLTAQEEERRAVAYDLHDGLTQYVMGAWAHLEGYRAAQNDRDDDGAREEFALALQYIHEAVVESRRLVNGLRTLALDDLGLAGAVEQMVFEEKSRAGWDDVSFTHNVDGERFHQTIETALYRVIQESLTNVRKHAAARQVDVRLQIEHDAALGLDRLVASVRDDGVGFRPESVPAHSSHVGLQGMSERMRLLEGTLTIDSEPGAGTRVVAGVPVFILPGGEAGTEGIQT